VHAHCAVADVIAAAAPCVLWRLQSEVSHPSHNTCVQNLHSMPCCRGSELDAELESHHGSQAGSGAVSEHEGDEIDEDEAAAAADFTPMTEEKRVFVNEWIAKLGNETFDDENQVEVRCCAAAPVL